MHSWHKKIDLEVLSRKVHLECINQQWVNPCNLMCAQTIVKWKTCWATRGMEYTFKPNPMKNHSGISIVALKAASFTQQNQKQKQIPVNCLWSLHQLPISSQLCEHWVSLWQLHSSLNYPIRQVLSCSCFHPWWCLGAFSEIVLEATGQVPQMAHATCSCCLPPDGLHTPVVGANACCRISTSWAPAFLNVETAATTAPAQRVRLVPALAKTTCSLTL
jgi:hypothetical protein